MRGSGRPHGEPAGWHLDSGGSAFAIAKLSGPKAKSSIPGPDVVTVGVLRDLDDEPAANHDEVLLPRHGVEGGPVEVPAHEVAQAVSVLRAPRVIGIADR